MRKKTVTIADDGNYVIGALSLDQVEEILSAPVGETDNQSGRIRIHEIIVIGLNNPLIDEAEKSGQPLADGKLWTIDKVRKAFDLVSLPIIKEEILKFSNLKQETPEPGEATAAQ